MTPQVYLTGIYFAFSTTEEGGARPNLAAHLTPIDSQGYHVRVYRNNLLFADYIHPLSRPLTEQAMKEYILEAYKNPFKVWPPVEITKNSEDQTKDKK